MTSGTRRARLARNVIIRTLCIYAALGGTLPARSDTAPIGGTCPVRAAAPVRRTARRGLPLFHQPQVNTGFTHIVRIPGAGTLTARFDVIALFDKEYQIRNETGVGVGAPQYGPRRGLFCGLSKSLGIGSPPAQSVLTTLMAIHETLVKLGADADGVDSQFATVDTDRDTVQRLHEYVSALDDRIRGYRAIPGRLSLLDDWRGHPFCNDGCATW